MYVTKPAQLEKTVGGVDLNFTTTTYSVVTTESFENRHAEVSKIIEQETGIQVRSSGGIGGFSTASIRGASSEQVAVYVDGVPLNQASGSTVDLSLIPLDNVERVELFRGSVPMELGNASLGGAINIITKPTTDNFKGKIKFTLGSFNTQQYNAYASGGEGKNSFILTANYLQSENDYEFKNDNGTPNNENDDRNEKRNNSAIEKQSVLAKWKYLIDSETNISTKLEWLDKTKQIPRVQNNPIADGEISLSTLDFFTQYSQKNFYSSNAELSAKIFVGNLEDKFSDSYGDNGSSPRLVNSETDNYGSEIFYKYAADIYQMKYRFLYERQNFTSESFSGNPLVSDSKQNSTRNYYEQVFEFKQFSFQNSLISSLTLRHVYAQDSNNIEKDLLGQSVDVQDREYNFFTPQLGLKYKFNSISYVNFNIGQYVRLPSFFELFGDQGFYRGTANLKEESGVNLDVGYLYSVYKPGSWFDNARLYAGYFHNTVDNVIVREVNAQGISVARNVANAEINGVEANVKLYPIKQWSIMFNATYIDSNINSDNSAYNDNRVPGVFEQDYSFNIAYSIETWSVGLSWDVKKNMFYDRPNLLPATDISDLNLSVLRKWLKHSLEFKVDNMLNNQYENFQLQPTAGTTYFMTYMYRL